MSNSAESPNFVKTRGLSGGQVRRTVSPSKGHFSNQTLDKRSVSSLPRTHSVQSVQSYLLIPHCLGLAGLTVPRSSRVSRCQAGYPPGVSELTAKQARMLVYSLRPFLTARVHARLRACTQVNARQRARTHVNARTRGRTHRNRARLY
jgi:hypothetical protein